MIHHVEAKSDGPLAKWYECWEMPPPPEGVEYEVLEESWNDDYNVRTIHVIRLLDVVG